MKKTFGYCEINNRGEGGGRGIIWYSRVFGVINYKSFSNSVFISLTRHHYHIPQICVTFFLCSDDTKNLQGISNPPPCCKSFEYRRFTLTIHLHFHTFTVLIEEKAFTSPISRNMLNSFSVVIFTRNCIPVMYERRHFIFIYGISNFSKFRLPRVLKPRAQDWISNVFIIASGISFSTFSIIISIDGSFLYDLFRVIIAVLLYVFLLLFEDVQTSGYEC